MRISEFFYSLQGEGLYAGVPSVFIRLAGCPLRCRWCDTAYARDFQAGTEQTAESLLSRAGLYPTRHLVVTGGEPLVQPDLAAFLDVFAKAGYLITLETAGLKFIADLPIHLLSVSPKLSNSVEPGNDTAESERLNTAVLSALLAAYRCQLKFVVDRPQDLDDIADCLERLGSVDPERVCLMPQAVRREEYIEKSLWLAEYCLQTGFAFSPRLQVMLYDGQRGK
ncbi:MAG TPA: 7-carboxy-7-deazaguanine synthase QueE [Phycisphaerales bacterium]|nr:7-carboxy-7-deazaguanine synthase QueE [Phycisphaerales bacterium]